MAAGYYRRGDLTTSLMPATYFVHGLTGYPPVMSAHGLPTAAFLSAGVDPLTYATIPTYAASAAAAAAQMQGSAAYDTNVNSDAATTSELSPGSTQNGVIDSNGTGNYTPPGYGNCPSLPLYHDPQQWVFDPLSLSFQCTSSHCSHSHRVTSRP